VRTGSSSRCVAASAAVLRSMVVYCGSERERAWRAISRQQAPSGVDDARQRSHRRHLVSCLMQLGLIHTHTGSITVVTASGVHCTGLAWWEARRSVEVAEVRRGRRRSSFKNNLCNIDVRRSRQRVIDVGHEHGWKYRHHLDYVLDLSKGTRYVIQINSTSAENTRPSGHSSRPWLPPKHPQHQTLETTRSRIAPTSPHPS